MGQCQRRTWFFLAPDAIVRGDPEFLLPNVPFSPDVPPVSVLIVVTFLTRDLLLLPGSRCASGTRYACVLSKTDIKLNGLACRDVSLIPNVFLHGSVSLGVYPLDT
jgi:hypothetical protein